ncbi:helix-turn-helix domain-containing protein [Gordonia sputi]
MNQLVTIADTQSALGGISRTTVYRLLDEGALKRVNIGRRSFITGDSINQYIDSLTEVSR